MGHIPPKPWTDKSIDDSFANIYDLNGNQVAQIQGMIGLNGKDQVEARKEVTKYIVKCVNAYDDLVAALEKIASGVEEYSDTYGVAVYFETLPAHQLRMIAKAALAKAKGE